MCNYKCFICYYCNKKLERSIEKKCNGKECLKIYVKNEKTLCVYCREKDSSILMEKLRNTQWINYETIHLKTGYRNFYTE